MLTVSYVIVGEKKFAMVPVHEMAIDSSYQRVLRNRLKKMITDWDYDKCDVLTVSFRNNKYYVVDGQHRYSAAKANNVKFLPCQVLENMTQEQEARKFVEMNTLVCKLSPFDTYNANLLLGDQTDTDIAELIKKYNLTISPSNGIGIGQIGSLSTCRKIVKRQGKACLDWIMRVLYEARWHEQKAGYSSRIMNALFHFYVNNKTEMFFYTASVIKALKSTTHKSLTASAKVMYPSCDTSFACSQYIEWLVKKIAKETKTA